MYVFFLCFFGFGLSARSLYSIRTGESQTLLLLGRKQQRETTQVTDGLPAGRFYYILFLVYLSHKKVCLFVVCPQTLFALYLQSRRRGSGRRTVLLLFKFRIGTLNTVLDVIFLFVCACDCVLCFVFVFGLCYLFCENRLTFSLACSDFPFT